MPIRAPLTGMSCDVDHPFPSPEHPTDWIDSMEYGSEERRPGSTYMQDIDTSPTWRMIGAAMWEASCFKRHVDDVADDPHLTTHLIAAAVLIGLPRRPIVYALALEQAGAAEAINALQRGGLRAAHAIVNTMGSESRRNTATECAALVLSGWTTMRLDIHDGVVMGVQIGRDQ